MLSFRIKCPECKRNCVVYPDEVVHISMKNTNPRLVHNKPTDELDVESIRVHCYFCKFEWWLNRNEAQEFVAGINRKPIEVNG